MLLRNYCTIQNVAEDVKRKINNDTVGIIFPILSRNRFSIILKGIALGVKKVIIMLSYPSDEVGNALISLDQVEEAGVNPYSDILDEATYRKHFGYRVHEFTGVDYVASYRELVENCGAECEIIFANNAKAILNYTKHVIACDIHTRFRTKRILKANGAEVVIGLDELMNESIDGSGFNKDYGLLGSNKSTEDKLKFFLNIFDELLCVSWKQF